MKGFRASARASGLLVVVLLFAARASGQQWARDMFNHTSHDFGTVARGAKVEHRFILENIYVEDAHVAWARASCGCTTPEITKSSLKTWEKAEIVAKVDTRGYLGQKDVTITVHFDRPFPADIQLQIHCYIRGDVVVQPGAVQFGTVAQGAGGRQRVSITYAGNPNWQIKQVESNNPNLTAQAVQVSRVGNQVAYDLIVDLAKNSPPGTFRDQVFLLTNDVNPRAARVPVPVEAIIQPGMTVHPEILFMGTVEPGQTITRPLIVRGIAPFRITRITSSDPRFQCEFPPAAATLHRVAVTFQASTTPGKASSTIRIETDTSAAPLSATVDVQVVASTGGQTPEPVTPVGASGKGATGIEPPGQPAPAAKGAIEDRPPAVKPAPEDSGPREL